MLPVSISCRRSPCRTARPARRKGQESAGDKTSTAHHSSSGGQRLGLHGTPKWSNVLNRPSERISGVNFSS